MAVSSRVKTRSSNKIVLPVVGDSTPVVLAQEPALPHITQTLADCTPTPMDREPASPNLTPTPADSNPVPVDTTPSPPHSSETRAVSKEAPVPKVPGLPRWTTTPPVSTRIPVDEAQPVIRSLASIAFDVVKSMCVSSHDGNIILVMKEKANCRCSSRSYVQVFMAITLLCPILSTSLLVKTQQMFPFFCVENDRFEKLRMR